MAKVFIDTAAHRPSRGRGDDYATQWYALGSAEPAVSRTLPIDAVHGIAPMTLEALLDSIIANCSPSDDIIIIGHGREGGLAMPLFRGSAARARSEVVNILGRSSAIRDPDLGSIPPVSDTEAAAICQIPVAQVQALRAKLAQVRAKSLRHVAFRACKIGAWPDVLRQYKPFFGCAEVSAPSLRDTYGFFNPTVPANVLAWAASWMHDHHTAAHTHTYSPQNVVVGTAGGQSDEHSYQNGIAAQDIAGLQSWQGAYLGVTPGNRPFPFHGQWHTTPLAGTPRIVFTGDPEYVRNLVVVR